MSQNTNTSIDVLTVNLLGTGARNWKWLLGLGVLFIILGTVGLGMAAMLTIVSVLFFGWLLLIGGLFQLVQTFTLYGIKNKTLQMAVAILYAATGALIVFDPEGGAFALTALMAISFIAIGILRIFMAFLLKGSASWLWVLFGGIISAIFGIYIFSQWESTAILIIGLLIAIEMLVAGWTYVMLALVVKRVSKQG